MSNPPTKRQERLAFFGASIALTSGASLLFLAHDNVLASVAFLVFALIDVLCFVVELRR